MKDSISFPPEIITVERPQAPGLKKSGVKMNDDQSASVTTNDGKTYNVSLNKDGTKVTVKDAAGNEVKGADLDKVKGAIRHQLEKKEDTTYDTMAESAPKTGANTQATANVVARLDRMGDLLGTKKERAVDQSQDTVRNMFAPLDHGNSPVDAKVSFKSIPKKA